MTIGAGLNFDLAGDMTTSLINAGSITALNNTDFRIIDIANNSGSISINSPGNATDLEQALAAQLSRVAVR